MKKIVFVIILFLCFCTTYSQEKQTNEGVKFERDSIRSLIPIKKQALLRDVDLIFNTRVAFNSSFFDGSHEGSKFNYDQMRLEIKGKIHEKVAFRFRDRYTREPVPGNLDNISRSVDMAFVKVDLSPRTNFTIGKMCADWGGYEFDFNPIDILTYNDIIENADNFLVGVGLAHTFADKKNSLSFQILNSRTKTYEEQYGSSAPPGIDASKLPLAFVANWRSSFFDGKWDITYSYSFFNEAKGKNMNYFALGNKFSANKFVLYYDFQYSSEDIDRKGIVSNIISSQFEYAAQDAVYLENWLRAEYLVSPKVNLLLTVMNSNHSWKGNPDSNASSKLSSSFGIIPTIQFIPFKDHNIRFYLAYTARKFNYTNYAETTFGVKDYTTGLLGIGLVAPLLVL